jgi:hypothetical protein
MTDPLEGLPPYPSLSSNQDHSNTDNTSTSNIPISDFRRNEARPILTDDGNCFFLYWKSICFLVSIRST